MAKERKMIKTPIGRVSYPHVFKPYKYADAKPTDEPQFEISLIFPKASTDFKEMAALVREVAREMFGDKLPAGFQSPFKPVDVAKNPDFNEGDIVVKFKSKYKPEVIDAKKRHIEEASGDFYPGCWARVSCSAYAYDKKGNKGVSFALGNVQKAKDDDRLGGGGTAADDDFDVLDVEDDSDSYLEDSELLG